MMIKRFWWRLVHFLLPYRTMYDEAVRAKQATGTGLLSQAYDICRLACSDTRLKPSEYYEYRLYDNAQFSWQDKRMFLGRKMQGYLVFALGMDRWSAVAHDKYLFHVVYAALGFPVPTLLALFQNFPRETGHPLLCSREDIKQFFRDESHYPLISKPLFGIYSRGVSAAERYDEHSGELVLTNGERLGLDSFVDSISDATKSNLFGKQGYIFQSLLSPHPEVAAVCGPRLCTLRLVVLLDESIATVHRGLWKVSSGDNMADNFWRQGNYLADIELATGTVLSVVEGGGENKRYIENHPDTHEPLVGFALPQWPEAVELCLRAARVIPELRIQGWDIALTDQGPVLLEVNVVGGVGLPQNAAARGMYDTQLRRFVAKNRLSKKYR